MSKKINDLRTMNIAQIAISIQDAQLDGVITNAREYGQHIGLLCINHPDLRWSTKNIAPIGCRTIYYNLEGDSIMQLECSCSTRFLMPVYTV